MPAGDMQAAGAGAAPIQQDMPRGEMVPPEEAGAAGAEMPRGLMTDHDVTAPAAAAEHGVAATPPHEMPRGAMA
jgi:hypothetical protein